MAGLLPATEQETVCWTCGSAVERSEIESTVDRYELITIRYYRAVNRFPDIKEALVPSGYLFVEHHLRSSEPTSSGPSSDRYPFSSNEHLHACLDLTVLYYDETTKERLDDGRQANARILARNTSSPHQPYPRQ